jgi:hypothetical protein
MSLLKTQFVVDNDSNLEEKSYRDDNDKYSSCILRPNSRSTIENSDIESDKRDFSLRGKVKML